MRARPLSRREAALGAAMLVALLLAWRETYGPPPLAAGPGRAAGARARVFGPVDGGHDGGLDVVGATRTLELEEELLHDAPAEPPVFTPTLALPPLKAGEWESGEAPSASLPSDVRRGESHKERRRRAHAAVKAGKERVPVGRGLQESEAARPRADAVIPERALAAASSAAATPRPSSGMSFKRTSRPAETASSARPRSLKLNTGRFDLFKPTRAARERSRRERTARPPRFKPLRFDRALGPRAIRPPVEKVAVPTLAQLSPRQPLTGPDGKPARWREAALTNLELVDPTGLIAACRARDGHWHKEEERRVYHAGAGRGLPIEDAWLWLSRLERRWWALPDAARAPWLRHQNRWWVQDDGVWFVLHEGEPWAWRHFARWEAEGLIHPASGTAIVYSADFARAAVLTPGEGAVLFDVETGQEIARWAEHELPPRWRPAPESLTLPRGI